MTSPLTQVLSLPLVNASQFPNALDAGAQWYNAALPLGSKVVPVGDSIIQNGVSGSASGVAASYDPRFELNWARWTDPNGPRVRCDIWNDTSVAGRFFKGGNQGISGQDETDTYARPATTLALGPAVVVLTIGTNGINSGHTAANIIASITSEVAYYLAAKARVWLGLVRPRGTFEVWGGSMWTAADAKWQVLADVNTGLRALAASTPGVTLWDNYAGMDDGAGHVVVADSIDGLHPDPLGAYATAVPNLLAIIQAQVTAGRYFTSDGAGSNLFPYNPFATTGTPVGQKGTGFSGTVPDGMRWGRSAGTTVGVCTTEADSDGGLKSVATLTPSGVVGQETVLLQPIDAGTGLGSGYIVQALTSGQWYRGRCFIEANNYPFREISFGVRAKVSTFLATANLPNDKTTAKGNHPYVTGGYWLETPTFVAGAAETGFNPALKITMQGDILTGVGGVSPIIKSSRWAFEPCADPRPLYNNP